MIARPSTMANVVLMEPVNEHSRQAGTYRGRLMVEGRGTNAQAFPRKWEVRLEAAHPTYAAAADGPHRWPVTKGELV